MPLLQARDGVEVVCFAAWRHCFGDPRPLTGDVFFVHHPASTPHTFLHTVAWVEWLPALQFPEAPGKSSAHYVREIKKNASAVWRARQATRDFTSSKSRQLLWKLRVVVEEKTPPSG